MNATHADVSSSGHANKRSRIGIDLGGTKIAGVRLGADDEVLAESRMPTPRDDYAGTLSAIAGIVERLDSQSEKPSTVGIAMPGSIAPGSGCVQNANSTWLNGHRFQADAASALERPVRCANDANCFVLSETLDGSAAGANSAFGVIVGTGCGGGLVVGGQLVNGARNIGGEWGHNPLPPSDHGSALRHTARRCWCGRLDCIETWVSGPGMANDHCSVTGETLTSEAIAKRAEQGDEGARQTLARHAARLAHGLAGIVNIIDPDVIVLGGGLSKLHHLYTTLPKLMRPQIFADDPHIDIRPPRWGDASGVRGAARLWDMP